MANKIISFGTSENLIDKNALSASQALSSSLEVYRDVNMESKFAGHLPPQENKQCFSIVAMIEEGKIDDAINFIRSNNCNMEVKYMLNDYIDVFDYNQSVSGATSEEKLKLIEWKNSYVSSYELDYMIYRSLSTWKIEKNVNVKAVFDSLRNIFSWNKCERILLPEFGSNLRTLLYEGITPQTEEAIVAEIYSCISEWEPRIQIVKVINISTIDDTEDNTMHFEVVFTIPSLSDEQYKYSFSYNIGS